MAHQTVPFHKKRQDPLDGWDPDLPWQMVPLSETRVVWHNHSNLRVSMTESVASIAEGVPDLSGDRSFELTGKLVGGGMPEPKDEKGLVVASVERLSCP
jgi:hypothetical protein